MRAQHVVSIGSNDQLPNPAALPNGYAVLRGGLTWVVRSHVWKQITPGTGGGSSIVPNPPAPVPPEAVVGTPTEQEILDWSEPIQIAFYPHVEMTSSDGSPYASVADPSDIAGGPSNVYVDSDLNVLAIPRPGFYVVSLRLLGANDDPTPNLRRYISAAGRFPQVRPGYTQGTNGAPTLSWSNQDPSAWGSGLIYVGAQDDSDSFLGKISFQMQVVHPHGHTDVGWARAEAVLTPVLFLAAGTAPANPVKIVSATGAISQGNLLVTAVVQSAVSTDVIVKVTRFSERPLPDPAPSGQLLGNGQVTIPLPALNPGERVDWSVVAIVPGTNLTATRAGSSTYQEG